jgi:signal transduction histidine kinase
VLDAARLEHAAADQPREEVDVPKVVAECAATVCSRYHVPADVVRIDATPCLVRAPQGDVELVFQNLIDNAVKYAGHPPRVSITIRLDDCGDRHRVVARIADNGRGIPPKYRGKIFGRFVRLGMELQRTTPGTGLGLYIVRTLVHRLGGRIRVFDPEPAADGSQPSGTVFEVTLPGGRAVAAPAEPSPAAVPAR